MADTTSSQNWIAAREDLENALRIVQIERCKAHSEGNDTPDLRDAGEHIADGLILVARRVGKREPL